MRPKVLWLVEWREAPPFDGYEFEVFQTKKAAQAAMKAEHLHFKGETLRLHRVYLGDPQALTEKKSGPVPT